MCVIIQNYKKGKLFSLINEQNIELCFNDNSDGFGITFFNHQTISTVKNFGLDNFKHTLRDIEKNSHFNYFIHFRKATVGKVCIENNHPFDVLGNQQLYLMHNGTLPYFSSYNTSQYSSDTSFLSDSIKKIISNNIISITSSSFQKKIHLLLGNNRAVLISKHHQVIFNQHLWFSHKNGLLFSKDVSSFLNTHLSPFYS